MVSIKIDFTTLKSLQRLVWPVIGRNYQLSSRVLRGREIRASFGDIFGSPGKVDRKREGEGASEQA